jgi:hypothetical protein
MTDEVNSKSRLKRLAAQGAPEPAADDLVQRLRAENAALKRPLTATDRQIAEAMICVDDPLQWGHLGEGNSNVPRQFAHALLKIIDAARKP